MKRTLKKCYVKFKQTRHIIKSNDNSKYILKFDNSYACKITIGYQICYYLGNSLIKRKSKKVWPT